MSLLRTLIVVQLSRIFSMRMEPFVRIRATTRNLVPDSSLIAIGAGAIAGSIGVGIAYPIDTIKTKIQTYAVKSGESLSFQELVAKISETEGLNGFYNGVGGVMLAQAFIKAAGTRELFYCYKLKLFHSIWFERLCAVYPANIFLWGRI
jgi:hypothetical protein